MTEGNIKLDLNWFRVRLFDEEVTQILHDRIKGHDKIRMVDTVKVRRKLLKPFPLTTVDLQRLLCRHTNLSSERIMRAAEQLYLDGYISYPRSGTSVYPKNFPFKYIIKSILSNATDEGIKEKCQKLLEKEQGAFWLPRNGNRDDKAHPPIHPVKYPQNLQNDERIVFDFVLSHFLASCMADAEYEEVTHLFEVAGEAFYHSGRQLITKNFMEAYGEYSNFEEKEIPQIQNGQELPLELQLHDGKTSPPPKMTESQLIKRMDQLGIGTDATIADHIQTIQ